MSKTKINNQYHQNYIEVQSTSVETKKNTSTKTTLEKTKHQANLTDNINTFKIQEFNEKFPVCFGQITRYTFGVEFEPKMKPGTIGSIVNIPTFKEAEVKAIPLARAIELSALFKVDFLSMMRKEKNSIDLDEIDDIMYSFRDLIILLFKYTNPAITSIERRSPQISE